MKAHPYEQNVLKAQCVMVQQGHPCSSQRSLQDAPIFRLLLKVAVKGTHQCDFTNFWGAFGLQQDKSKEQGAQL